MKKILFILASMASLFFCGSFVSQAQPADFAASVDEAAARRIAIEFVGRNLPGSVLKSDRSEGLTTAFVSKGEEGENCFYVFNIGQDKGFVIVSGDSRAPAVLGYAEKGSFHYDEAPENMKWWLSEYARQIGQISGDLVVGVREGLKTSKESGVLPLLDDIAYNQDEPFNKFCPVLPDGTTAPTGCVATAVAQIMRYYGHPLTGTGSHSYTWENANGGTQVLSADFGATQYDWDNMLSSYEEGYNDDQAEAVATIMYHLGVAFEMDYAPVSLVSSSSVPPALHGFFGYDGAMSYRSRSNYSDEDWKALIRAELEAGRPVYYGGQADGGGHAFVLDGYQADDYFHVNWGWSGHYDGYFLLDALNPEGQGTGGFEGGYNRYQDMLIGIRPEAGGVFQPVIYSLGISAVDDSVLRDGGRIRLSGNFSNWDWDTARAEIGMLLYDESEELVDTLGLSGQVLFTPYGGGFSFDKEHPFEDAWPQDLPEGLYKIYYGYRTGEDQPWKKVQVSPDTSSCVQAEVKGEKVYFTTLAGEGRPEPPATPAHLEVSEGTTPPKEVYQHEDFTVEAVIINTGGTDFDGELCLVMSIGEFSTNNIVGYSWPATPCHVPGNGEQTVTFTHNVGSLSPGTYYFYIATVEGDMMTPLQGESLPYDAVWCIWVDVLGNGSYEEPELWLVSDQTEYPGQVAPNEDFSISTVVMNTGGDYTGTLYMGLFQGDNIVYQSQPVVATVPSGGSYPVSFEGSTAGLSEGTYDLYIGYIDGMYFVPIPMDDGGYLSLRVGVGEEEGSPELYLDWDESEMPSVVYQNEDFTASTVLHNAGTADFSGDISVLVLDESGSVQYNTNPVRADVPSGKFVTVDFSGNVGMLSAGDYLIGIGYAEGMGIVLISDEEGYNVLPVQVKENPLENEVFAKSPVFRLFPNPVDRHLQVECRDGMERIRVYSSLGTPLLEVDCQGRTSYCLETVSLSAGLYLLQVETDKGIFIERFVKK